MRLERDEEIIIPADGATVEGHLTVPENARGVVLFAHGSGSSRRSTRNRYVADVLNKSRLATLLIDLLTRDEGRIDEKTGHFRFDIDLLARRLDRARRWTRTDESTANLEVGYFGASTGAAAALIAAADAPDDVAAVVSRGGRPDLAQKVLPKVASPTLLIVGGRDHQVIPLNEQAYAALHVEKCLKIIEGATHLFEEAGALDQVADLAEEWFVTYLPTRQSDSSDTRDRNRSGNHGPSGRHAAVAPRRNAVSDRSNGKE